jgi:acid phosphatase
MKMFSPFLARSLTVLAASTAAACSSSDSNTDNGGQNATGKAPSFEKINHFVVIYLENHSFDNLYGQFPGAEGISKAAKDASTQVDLSGQAYTTLPTGDDGQDAPQAHLGPLANAPFPLTEQLVCTKDTPAVFQCADGAPYLTLGGGNHLFDLNHNFFAEQIAINGGKMNRYVAANFWSGGLSLGYYSAKDALPVAEEAKNWTVCDHFFHAAFGGSFINHQWLIAARPPEYLGGTPPDSIMNKTKVGEGGRLELDGPPEIEHAVVQLDGKFYMVSTLFSPVAPNPPNATKLGDATKGLPGDQFLLPSGLQTHATIGDRLSEKKLDWAWYSGGFDDALRSFNDAAYAAANVDGKFDPIPVFESTFQFHHQPFLYFQKYGKCEGGNCALSDEGKAHLRDEADFIKAAKEGTLPAVSFVKPIGANNEHSGYAELLTGEKHVIELIDAIKNGPNWKDTAIVITYDEYGGFWDHVPPPTTDVWGPGSRVPAIVISPYAKKGYVDSTVYDTTSILATIEKRWNLAPLSDRDKNAKDLSASFDFTSPR